MNGGEADRWSAAATGWSELWGDVARPAWNALLDAAGITPGTRVLDVGCGSGELLAFLAGRGVIPHGCDPAPGMLAMAAANCPTAVLRPGGFGALPWAHGEVDVVLAVNALQFAADPIEALRESAGLVGPGGRVGIANWAEAELNDLEGIEAALAIADGVDPSPDDVLRLPGGLVGHLSTAGLVDVVDGLVRGSWTSRNDSMLVAAVLLGEDDDGLAQRGDEVLWAARHLRASDGSTRLSTAFRWAVGTVPT